MSPKKGLGSRRRFRTTRELPRQVGRLAGPDTGKSESHGLQPAERRARDGAGWRSRRRRSGSDTDDARGGDRGAGLGGAESRLWWILTEGPSVWRRRKSLDPRLLPVCPESPSLSDQWPHPGRRCHWDPERTRMAYARPHGPGRRHLPVSTRACSQGLGTRGERAGTEWAAWTRQPV